MIRTCASASVSITAGSYASTICVGEHHSLSRDDAPLATWAVAAGIYSRIAIHSLTPLCNVLYWTYILRNKPTYAINHILRTEKFISHHAAATRIKFIWSSAVREIREVLSSYALSSAEPKILWPETAELYHLRVTHRRCVYRLRP